MGWKDWFNWQAGLLYFIGFAIGIVIRPLIDNRWGWAESLQTAFFFGIILFFIAGFSGKILWNYRWFKLISVGILLTWIFYPYPLSEISLFGIEINLPFIFIPLIVLYLIFDSQLPAWIRGMFIGFSIPFWYFYLSFIIRPVDTGWLALVLFYVPLIIIAFIGLIIRAIIDYKNKGNIKKNND